MPDGDVGLPVPLEPGNERRNAIVQTHLAALHEQHHARRGRHDFGQRREVEDRIERHRLDGRHQRPIADRFLIQHPIAPANQHDGARELLLGDRALDERLDRVELPQIDSLFRFGVVGRPRSRRRDPGRGGLEPRCRAASSLADSEREREGGPAGELHHSAVGLYFAVMSRLRGVLRPALLLSLLSLAGAAGLAAQALVGRVAGTIRDDAGKPVAGATITASNPEQALTLTATSDTKGRFGILGLRRGVWVFSIAAPGFQRVSQAGEVQLGNQNPPLNIKLVKRPIPPAGPLSTLTGPDIQTMIDAAESSASSGDLQAAIGGYRDLLSKVPALTSAHLRIGTLLEQKGDVPAALEAYRELVRLEPDNTRAAAAIARLTRIP